MNEKKHEEFEEPDIQSIIQGGFASSQKNRQKSLEESASEHLPCYLQFFQQFEYQNKPQFLNDQLISSVLQTSQQDSKIKIKQKSEIHRILVQKGVLIQNYSPNQLQKRPSEVKEQLLYEQSVQAKLNVQSQLKHKDQYPRLNRQKSDGCDFVDQEQQIFTGFRPNQKNLNNQCNIQKWLKINKPNNDPSKCSNLSEISINFVKYPFPQVKQEKAGSQKSLDFKILQILSTHSPQAYEIVCSIGQIYTIRFSLLINLSKSQIHKHMIYSQGSYGSIYLLNGQINRKNSKKNQNFQTDKYCHQQCCSNCEFPNSDGNFEENKSKNYFVVKCFRLKQHQVLNELLQNVLKQYCINYLMSALEIGPKVVRKFGFDILVYENCIQYCLQFCQTRRRYEQGRTDTQLKTALLTMHQLNLVHMDIKPDNIAYSPSFNKWVFIDFGLSDFIEQNLGQKTYLCYVGTYEYSSPQMKKALTSDSYVDLYYNDIHALKKSFMLMPKSKEVLMGNKLFAYQDNTLSQYKTVDVNRGMIEEVLMMMRLKYWLIREHSKRSSQYFKCMFNVKNEQISNNKQDKSYQGTGGNAKTQVGELFALLSKQTELEDLKEKQSIYQQNAKSSNLLITQQYLSVYKDEPNTTKPKQDYQYSLPSHKKKNQSERQSAKTQIVRFYKSLLMSEFYLDFYYEHIAHLIEDSSVRNQIQTKIKSNIMHHLVRFHSEQLVDDILLQKVKAKLFYKEVENEINISNDQQNYQRQTSFEDLHAIPLYFNQNNYHETIFIKKSRMNEESSIIIKKKKQLNKGIMHLRQKLMDASFLQNLSQQEYFNLFYRYVTFKKNIYKAKLSQKLAVAEFFLQYWQVDRQQCHDFQKFFTQFTQPNDLQSMQEKITTISLSSSILKISQQEQIERRNYKRKKVILSQQDCPIYSIILCFRFMIANCIYIESSNFEKRQLFVSLACEYFMIDHTIMTCDNDFNYLIPWYRIVIQQLSFFKSQQQKLTYLSKVSHSQEHLQLMLQKVNQSQNFLELLEKVWRLNQASRILNYRTKPVKLPYVENMYYKNHIDFIIKDQQTLRKHFSTETAMKKILKFIEVEENIHKSFPTLKNFPDLLIQEEELTIVKNEILKNKKLTDLSKINLLKRISIHLYIYNEFIQETDKISKGMTTKVLPQKHAQKNTQKQHSVFENQLQLLKASQIKGRQTRAVSNAKKMSLQLINTPFSYMQIQQFHFHLAQRLRIHGNILDSHTSLRRIDKTIDCPYISGSFLLQQRRFIAYYIDKDYKMVVDLFEQSVSALNSYEIFCNVDWLVDLINFSNLFLTEQSFKINKRLTANVERKQLLKYMQFDSNYITYLRFLKIHSIFVDKLKKYVKTLIHSLQSYKRIIPRQNYNNFLTIIRQALFCLLTQPPVSNASLYLYPEGMRGNYQKEKNFFYDVFERSLPFCLRYFKEITEQSFVRNFTNFFHNDCVALTREFMIIKIEARAIRYFQQKQFQKTIKLIYQNLYYFGITNLQSKYHSIQNVQHVRILIVYVKAFFIKYLLKQHCWFEKYNFPNFQNLKINYNEEEIKRLIQKQQNLISPLQTKYFTTYKNILHRLYLYFVTTGNFEIAMKCNSPTLQFLLQTAMNVYDQKAYFKICLYLISLSRYLSTNKFFQYISYVIASIEEFAHKNISPVTKPLFQYLMKFAENILLKNYEEFQNESKEWKNPHWWILVNLFLLYSDIQSLMIKKILLKIASVMQYLNFKIRQQIQPIFYFNLLRMKDLFCVKGLATIKQLKNQLIKLHKYKALHNPHVIPIIHYLRLRVKSFVGFSPIIFSREQDQEQKFQRQQIKTKQNFKSNIMDGLESEKVDFHCLKFQGYSQEINSNSIKTDYSNSSESSPKNSSFFDQRSDSKQNTQPYKINSFPIPSVNNSNDKKQAQQTKTKPKQQSMIRVIFNLQFDKKVQEVERFNKGFSNKITNNYCKKATENRILNVLIRKIYTQQRNIGNVYLQQKYQMFAK